ncbi:MAG: nitroreductase/quinone reductase family protein [Acidimicrobiia bacterium]|nr:nitroreductase/quinone reductase family protein [Acidimicrobiia bacterium]
MSDDRKKGAWLPPRWFVRFAWSTHKRLYRLSGGRFGLRRAKGDSYGMMHVTTIGRRSGQERGVILGYFDDGPNLVTMAMNGWGEGEPAWWLNLQAHPEVTIHTPDGRREARGRAAEGEERSRLWNRWREIDKNLDDYAARRSGETAVVILEPASGGNGS